MWQERDQFTLGRSRFISPSPKKPTPNLFLSHWSVFRHIRSEDIVREARPTDFNLVSQIKKKNPFGPT